MIQASLTRRTTTISHVIQALKRLAKLIRRYAAQQFHALKRLAKCISPLRDLNETPG